MGLLDTISPTERSKFLGLLADAVQGASDFAAKPFGYSNPPGEMLAGILGGPAIAKTLDRLSYGDSLTNIGKANVPLLKPETVDAAMSAAPLAALAGMSAVKYGHGVAEQAFTNGNLLKNTLVNDKIGNLIESARASKSPSIFDPKPTTQRPFNVDYPKGIAGQDGSRVAFSIDGDPLTARYIAGRRVVGGMDEGIAGNDADGIASALGIQSYQTPRTGLDLRRDAGRYVGGAERKIFVDQSLHESDAFRVFQHELGHGIDDLVFNVMGPRGSKIPTDGIKKELYSNHENLNTPFNFKRGRGATPQSHGYSESEVDAELMAEAACLNPLWFKDAPHNFSILVNDGGERNYIDHPFHSVHAGVVQSKPQARQRLASTRRHGQRENALVSRRAFQTMVRNLLSQVVDAMAWRESAKVCLQARYQHTP